MLLILINARSLDHRVSIKTQFELAMTFTSIRLFKICKTAVCWERPQTVNLEIWVDAFFLIMVFLASLRDMTSYVSKKYLKSGLFSNFLRKLLRYAKGRFLQVDWFAWLKKKPQQQGRQRKENDLRNLGWTENVWLPYLCLWYILLFSHLIVLRMLNQTWLQWCLCVKMTKAMGSNPNLIVNPEDFYGFCLTRPSP